MKNIKFRAWNKKDKFYSSVGEIIFCQGGIKVYGPGVYIGNGWASEDNGFKHECDVILEQFAGLYDKNDKEIYENDLVKMHNTIFKIEIDLLASWMRSKRRQLLLFEAHSNELEVIGNIYENPELNW